MPGSTFLKGSSPEFPEGLPAMASLPRCGTGPAATATQAARSVRRWSRCSSSGSVLLPLDGLLPDPRRNLHGLVSRASLRCTAEPVGASSMPRPYEVTLQGMMAGMLAVHVGRSQGPSGAMPSFASGLQMGSFGRLIGEPTERAPSLHDQVSSTGQRVSA